MGGTSKPKVVGNAPLGTPEQMNFINSLLGGAASSAQQGYGEFLQPYNPENFQDIFQQSFISPALQAYEQDILPSIQSKFVNANAGSSSALNQALARSAENLATSLGSQMGNFYLQNQQNKLGALGQLGGLAGSRQLEPLIQKPYSPWGDVIGAAGQIGAAGLPSLISLSSREYKENIRTFEGGLEKVKALRVKKYDFKDLGYGIGKDCIGLIAEEVPEEIYFENDGKKGVDVYGLCSLLVNAVQKLSEKVDKLEESHANCI